MLLPVRSKSMKEMVNTLSLIHISGRVQERVKAAIENMTGLQVLEVNIRIASVDMENSK